MNLLRRQAMFWLVGSVLAVGCATQPAKVTSTGGSNRSPASETQVTPTNHVNLCGRLYYAESNRHAVDDSDANYFLRVDCRVSGPNAFRGPGPIVNIIGYRSSDERGALTRTRRAQAKQLDKAQAQMFKSVTAQGWTASSRKPQQQLPYERRGYRSEVLNLYTCADLLVSADPCQASQNSGSNVVAQLNWYTTETDKARIQTRVQCIKQGRQDCFAGQQPKGAQ